MASKNDLKTSSPSSLCRPPRARSPLACWPGLLALGLAPAWAQDAPPDATLGAVQVQGATHPAIGGYDSVSEGHIDAQTLARRPALRTAEVLESVPGLVVTQHSGDGKAGQYFLRGFNLDHGSDFSVTLDGMPINMASHGHAQGYTNLNVLIPDLLSGIAFRKGPYYVGDGDFSLAGSAALSYLDRLDRPFAQVTVGPNQYRRTVLAGSRSRDDQHWLGALEWLGNDGPWDHPQNLHRANALLRYSQGNAARGLSFTGMLHQSAWNSTDQVPLREVEAGRLSPWGAIDPSDGGRGRRASLSGRWHERHAEGRTEVWGYAVRSATQLWSNFTYFLNRPVEGDQFEQEDVRNVYGLQARHERSQPLAGFDGALTLGAGWRGDRVSALGLYLTQQRVRDTTVRQDQVTQDMVWLYAQQMLQLRPDLRGTVGLRLDTLRYRVRGQEPVYGALNSGQGQASLWQPKAGLAWQLAAAHELYANVGVGFHSNDARGTTIRIDPKTGEPVDRVPALVRGTGAELGWKFAPSPALQAGLSLWALKMGSELVFVGDDGTTEAGRASRRVGIEATTHWAMTPNWTLDGSWAQSRSRFTGEAPAGEGNFIDNAVNRVVSAVLAWRTPKWLASLQLRHMGPRPLDTLGVVRSQGSTLLNARLGYHVNERLSLGLEVFNLTNRRSQDIEYFYASCTAREVLGNSCGTGVEDRHVHPMEPRSARLTARLSF